MPRPTIAKVIGIKIISFNVKLPVLDEVRDTIIIDEIIVAGMEYFLIPKYNGIKAIPGQQSHSSIRKECVVRLMSLIVHLESNQIYH